MRLALFLPVVVDVVIISVELLLRLFLRGSLVIFAFFLLRLLWLVNVPRLVCSLVVPVAAIVLLLLRIVVGLIPLGLDLVHSFFLLLLRRVEIMGLPVRLNINGLLHQNGLILARAPVVLLVHCINLDSGLKCDFSDLINFQEEEFVFHAADAIADGHDLIRLRHKCVLSFDVEIDHARFVPAFPLTN